MAKINYPVVFNGVDLSTLSGVTVLRINAPRPGKRDLNISNLIRTEKSKVASANWTEKVITIGIEISESTRDRAELSQDTLMTFIQDVEAVLQVPQSGSTRSYTATLDDVMVRKDGGAYLDMDLVFRLSDTFGYDSFVTNLFTIPATSTANRQDQFTPGGSARWQLPVFSLVFSVLTGGTGKSLTIGNSDTGQQITITRNWVAGDVVIVDSNLKSVKVNNVEVAFTGAFPEFRAGRLGTWYYSDGFTTRTFTGTITYVKRYV